jgi:hypothetical protein
MTTGWGTLMNNIHGGYSDINPIVCFAYKKNERQQHERQQHEV